MIQVMPLGYRASSSLLEPNGLAKCRKSSSSISGPSASGSVVCSSTSTKKDNASYIPKLEPFSRNKIDRAVKEPPLIQKSENQIADYCLTLDGDESYSCWKAYFELKELEQEAPKEEVERLIMEAGGVKSLIDCVHGVAAIHKEKKQTGNPKKMMTHEKNTGASTCPIPDGLPKTAQELEEEEKARMPDSQFTRLLRARGRHPAWYSPAPEHAD